MQTIEEILKSMVELNQSLVVQFNAIEDKESMPALALSLAAKKVKAAHSDLSRSIEYQEMRDQTMPEQPITLQFLLEQAGGLPHAEALWAEHVTPTHPELELCDYWVQGQMTTLSLNDTDDDTPFEVWWEINEAETHIDADDEEAESAFLHWPLVDEILQMEIME